MLPQMTQFMHHYIINNPIGCNDDFQVEKNISLYSKRIIYYNPKSLSDSPASVFHASFPFVAEPAIIVAA